MINFKGLNFFFFHIEFNFYLNKYTVNNFISNQQNIFWVLYSSGYFYLQTKKFPRLINWLILMACQSVWGYFMLKC